MVEINEIKVCHACGQKVGSIRKENQWIRIHFLKKLLLSSPVSAMETISEMRKEQKSLRYSRVEAVLLRMQSESLILCKEDAVYLTDPGIQLMELMDFDTSTIRQRLGKKKVDL